MNVSEQDSFSEREEKPQNVRSGEVARRIIGKYFSTLEVWQVEDLTKTGS
jgi:hypothetical protein